MSFTTKSPLIIGHRGASAVAPENTIAAFARALADGADGIELDVRLARDGVLVVIHDSSLRRTGKWAGLVEEMTSAELNKIDVGSWFNRVHPRFARVQYAQQRVPTLNDVFTFLKGQSQRKFVAYVELKARNTESSLRLSESVVKLINAHSLQERIVVISFNLKAVAMVKELDGSIRTGALFEPRPRAIRTIRRQSRISAALECDADEILLHRLIARRRSLSRALEEGLAPVVWTVDDFKWIVRAKNRGIHALITNDPARMIDSDRTV